MQNLTNRDFPKSPGITIERGKPAEPEEELDVGCEVILKRQAANGPLAVDPISGRNETMRLVGLFWAHCPDVRD